MGLIPNIFGKKNSNVRTEVKLPFNVQFSKTPLDQSVKKEKMYTLTNLARQQLGSMDGTEPEFQYLSTMTSKKAWSIDDLSNSLKVTDGRVLYDVRILEKKQLVKVIGASGE